MALIYAPINGQAGSVTFFLIDRDTAEVFSSATLNSFEFEEEDEESEFNETFVNINDELVKDYYGYRKRITFSIVNGLSGDGRVLASTNLGNILTVISMLNLVNLEPLVYRLEIQYRTGVDGVISDAVYVGNFKLKEISNKSNSGQIIQLEFVSRTTSNLLYSVPDYADYICLEDGDNILLGDGNDLLAETYTII
jgi:hypothetical protein